MRNVAKSPLTVFLAVGAVASSALAGGPTTQPADPPPPFKTHDELNRHYARKLREAREIVLREREAALQRFVRDAKGDDLERGLRDLTSVALEVGDSKTTIAAADRYAKEFPAAAQSLSVAGMRITALARAGQFDAAQKGWNELADKAADSTPGVALDAGFTLADEYILAQKVDDARKIYGAMRDRFGEKFAQLGHILDRATPVLKWIGKAPPALEGKDHDGKPLSLDAYRGRYLLIDYWATYCGPCMAELPKMHDVYTRYHEEGFDIVGISVDPSEQPLDAFLKRTSIPWRIAWDGDSGPPTNSDRYEVDAVPTTFLIGPDGKVVYVNASSDDLERMLPRLLARRAN